MRHCSDNEISKLPAVVTTLTRLTELRAAHNKFASLPSAIGRLRDIRYLDLSHNKVGGT
jgi:Leucine-rich repeat (LRR) protein